MNYFILDYDVKKSVCYLDNKRLSKMMVETCQVLSTVFRDVIDEKFVPEYIYKSTHKNHPVVKWCCDDVRNFKEMVEYLGHGIEEQKRRFGTEKELKVERLYGFFKQLVDEEVIDAFMINKGVYNHYVLCMPNNFEESDVIVSYRKYFSSKENIYYDYEDIPVWLFRYRTKPIYVRYNKKDKYKLTELKEIKNEHSRISKKI